jgi:transposase
VGGRAEAAQADTGSISALTQTKFRGRILDGQDDRLAAAITAQPDATLRELREALKTSAGLATIWRAVQQLDLTVKKNRTRRRTTTD